MNPIHVPSVEKNRRPHTLFRTRSGKWLVGIVIFLAVYTVAGFFLVPALIKWQLHKRLPPATHRIANIRQVKFNPYALSLTINGLSLSETNGDPFASWDQFYINFQASSLFRRAWTFDEIRLVEPHFHLVLGPDGAFNFRNLIDTNAAPKPTNQVESSHLPAVIISRLAITNGHVAFTDLTLKTPFRASYEPINLNLRDFTTRPNQNSPYAFEAAGDGGRSIAWSGTVSANPAASAGLLRLTGIDLPRHAPYIEAKTGALVTGGIVNIEAGYSFAAATNGMDLVVSNVAVSVNGLQINDPDTREVVYAMPQYELRGGTFDWRAQRVDVESIQIDEPSLLARRLTNGALNLLTVVKRKPSTNTVTTNTVVTAATNATPWTFSLGDFRLNRGKIIAEDLAVAGTFRTTLSPISMHIGHFSTASESNAQVEVQIVSEAGEKINLETSACIAPLRASGGISLSNVDLKKYLAYSKPFFTGQIPQGYVDVMLPFSHFITLTNTHQAIVTNGSVRLRDLAVLSPDGGEKWIEVPALAVNGIGVNLLEKTAEIGAIGLTNSRFAIRREKSGSLNLLALLASGPKAGTTNRTGDMPGTTASTNVSAPWRLELGELALANWELNLEDRTLSNPGTIHVDHLGLNVRGFQFPSNAPLATEFSARLNSTGTVNTRGVIRPYSGEIDTEVAISGIELAAVQPWLDPYVRLTLNNATMNGSGRLIMASTNGPGPRIHFTGNLALTNFLTTEQLLDREFARWREFEISGADVSLAPNAVEIQRVRMNGLRTAFIIGPDKRPNFATILRASPTNSTAAQNPVAAQSPAPQAPAITNSSTPVRIAELKIEDSSLLFRDESIKPAAVFDLKQFGGVVRGLSSEPGSTAQLDVYGQVDESAPFGVRGTVNPFSKDLWLDVVLTNQNMQLTPFTPYMEKFVGYPLTRGRLSLDVGYAIKEGQLKAHNVVRIDHLTLGQRNNSPDATKLPVKLGIALLKDVNGRIELDIPLQGNLKDPEFRVAPIVLKVVMNLITKAAASPFKLLGGLVGGGEELSYVDFEPGLAEFRATETNKLEKLVNALQQRPELNLEIQGSFDPVADRAALAHALVRSDADQLRREEASAGGQSSGSGASPIQEDPEYERLLRVLASRQFGTNLAEALLSIQTNAPSTNVVASAPAAAPKLITYVTGAFKSKAERARLAQQRKKARDDALLFKSNPALAATTGSTLEELLAAHAAVPADALRQLRRDRARAVQNSLLGSGVLKADRLLLLEPQGAADDAAKGEARVILTVN